LVGQMQYPQATEVCCLGRFDENPCLLYGSKSIVGAESGSQSPELVAFQQKQLQSFKEFQAVALFPSDIIEEYRCNKSCDISQMKLFQHMTNRVARDHWKSDRSAPLQPSAWLDAVITCEQKALLAPTPADIARASIINETIGEGARKKIAKSRINFIDGNITNYSRLLNSSEQLTSMKEINSLTTIIGEIRTEREHEKSERASAKASEVQKSKNKQLFRQSRKKRQHSCLTLLGWLKRLSKMKQL